MLIGLGIFVWWLIGVLILRFWDPMELGAALGMFADSRHRSYIGIFLYLFIAWFLWPMQLSAYFRERKK